MNIYKTDTWIWWQMYKYKVIIISKWLLGIMFILCLLNTGLGEWYHTIPFTIYYFLYDIYTENQQNIYLKFVNNTTIK